MPIKYLNPFNRFNYHFFARQNKHKKIILIKRDKSNNYKTQSLKK